MCLTFYSYKFDELETFFYQLLNEYLSFQRLLINHKINVREKCHSLKFPYENLNKNQDKLMIFVNEVEEEKKIKRKKIRNNENVNILLISTQNCIDAHKNKLGIVNSLIFLQSIKNIFCVSTLSISTYGSMTIIFSFNCLSRLRLSTI